MTKQPKTKPFKCMASAFTKDGDLQTSTFTIQATDRADAFMRASNRVTLDATSKGMREAQVHQINGRFV
ncbi:hypothetical protein LCGC14_1614000 [marine sediment metagenome]|uniref:Uncharacterized protein n=1 Tax=marine sediment metagenome TaxID=412755 RepID=A0A0F9KN52_9ZZZZ